MAFGFRQTKTVTGDLIRVALMSGQRSKVRRRSFVMKDDRSKAVGMGGKEGVSLPLRRSPN